MSGESGPLAPICIVCFAVKEEARFFKTAPKPQRQIRMVVTGMGARNAEHAIRKLLEEQKPSLILTCGFAGALKPDLTRNTVVFEVDPETNLRSKLLSSGAVPVVFHCARGVVTTAGQKRALRQNTGADVVEMESGVIRAICRGSGISSGTVRVVLDTANEDLPLDFNELMTADQRLDFKKLLISLMKAPWKIGPLIRLQSQSAEAARKLALILNETLLR